MRVGNGLLHFWSNTRGCKLQFADGCSLLWSKLCRAPRNNVLFADSHNTRPWPQAVLFTSVPWLIWEPATRFVKMSTSEQPIWRRTLSLAGNKTSCEVFAAKHLSAVCYSAVRLMLQKCRPSKTRHFQAEVIRIFSVNLGKPFHLNKRHSRALCATRGGRTTRHLWVSK